MSVFRTKVKGNSSYDVAVESMQDIICLSADGWRINTKICGVTCHSISNQNSSDSTGLRKIEEFFHYNY